MKIETRRTGQSRKRDNAHLEEGGVEGWNGRRKVSRRNVDQVLGSRDLLGHILSYVTHGWSAVRRVNKQFKTCVDTRGLARLRMRKPEGETQESQETNQQRREAFLRILRETRNIQTVDLSHCTDVIDDAYLLQVIEVCKKYQPRLSYISIAFCHRVTCQVLAHLPSTCRLYAPGCYKLFVPYYYGYDRENPEKGILRAKRRRRSLSPQAVMQLQLSALRNAIHDPESAIAAFAFVSPDLKGTFDQFMDTLKRLYSPLLRSDYIISIKPISRPMDNETNATGEGEVNRTMIEETSPVTIDSANQSNCLYLIRAEEKGNRGKYYHYLWFLKKQSGSLLRDCWSVEGATVVQHDLLDMLELDVIVQ